MTLLAAAQVATVSQSLTVFALGFTSETSSLRPLFAAIVWPITWYLQKIIWADSWNPLCRALVSTALWIQCLKTFDDLCLTRLSFRDGRRATKTSTGSDATLKPQTQLDGSSEVADRLLFGFENLWNMRGIATKAEIAQIPPWSSKDRFFVPSRSQEITRHVKNLAISFVLLSFFVSQSTEDNGMTSPKHEKLFTRLDDIDLKEAAFRFAASFSFWINLFCMLHFVNSIIGILLIGLGLYPVKLVPPIWGNFSDAYTVRKFWGSAWHQTLRRVITSWSDFIVHGILRMPKASLIARYCKLALSFLISGTLHVWADMGIGVPAQQSNAISFFLTTSLLIMLEDAVQYLHRRVRRGDSGNWPRYFGYCWMCCYVYWLSPSWSYPAARTMQSNNYLGNLSLTGVLSLIRQTF